MHPLRNVITCIMLGYLLCLPGCIPYSMLQDALEYNDSPPGSCGSDLADIVAFCGNNAGCIERSIEKSNNGTFATARRKFENKRGALRVVGRKKHANGSGYIIYGERMEYPDDRLGPPFAMLKLTYDTNGTLSTMSYKLLGVENNELKDIPLTLDWLQ